LNKLYQWRISARLGRGLLVDWPLTAHNLGMRDMIVILAMVFVTLCGTAANATQDDPRLDALFERLQTTKDSNDAAAAERQIWSIWMEAESEDLNILMNQGAVAMSSQNFDLALESFNALITLAPEMAEAWNKRATLYFMMQNFEASVADVQKTLSLEPRHFGAIVGMGLIYERLGDQKAALRAFEQGLKINPHMEHIREKTEKLGQELQDRNI